MPRALSLLLTLLLPLAPATLLAQEPESEETPRESGVTEEVNVRLVELSVTATDRDGRAVTDLEPEDLEVKARGREMRIAFVEPVYEAPELERQLPEVRLRLEAPGGSVESIAETQKRKAHYFIFVIDVENDDKLQRPRAIDQISQFIVRDMADEDYAAVISFNGKINIEVPFTRERGALTEAISRAYLRAPRPSITKQRRIEQLIEALDDCVLNVQDAVYTANERCVQDMARVYSEELTPTSRNFIEALEGIVRYAGGLDGRGTVFAVSHGVTINPAIELFEAVRSIFGDTDQVMRMQLDLVFGEGVRHETDALIQLALREGVTFYFLDRTSAPAGLGGARQQGFYKAGTNPMGVAYKQPQADMGEVAGATGGSFITEKSVYDALTDAMQRERGRYTVGFYVDELLDARDLSRIRVKAGRRGVRLNAGRGTYQKRQYQDSGLGDIRFGQTKLLEGERQGRFIPFTILAPPRRFGYERTEGAMAAQLTLHFIVQTGQGEVLTDAYHFLSHGYPTQIWEAGKEGPIAIPGWLEAPPGDYRLIALLRNAKTGQGGRIIREIRVVVPDEG